MSKNTTVSGKISSLFHGLELTEETRKQACLDLIGLPVTDGNGKEIGKIMCLDLDNDTWYAKVTEYPKTDLYLSSMEIKEE